MLTILRKLILQFKQFISWIFQQKGTSKQLSRGLAIGVFCGFLPLFGFQTLLGISLAILTRSNRLLAVAGTWISNPFTYVPIYWFNYQIGSLLFGLSKENIQLNADNIRSLWDQSWILGIRFLVGSLVVGLLAGLITYIISFLTFRGRKHY